MAASYSTVGYGSQGDAVRLLQNTLNDKGYSLSVDGIFGSKTLAAVRDYQSKNSLSVDGIVGNNTWSSLMTPAASESAPEASKGPTSSSDILSGVSDETAQKLASLSGGYTQSDTVSGLKDAYESLLASAPGGFSSKYDEVLDELYREISDRESFSYDPYSDPLYENYRDEYERQGRMSMMDAMGSAAALTGGYGSTYSQAEGESAYRNYLSRLNELLPQLYSMAKDSYDSETDDLYSRLSAASDMYDRDYGAYRDSVLDYYEKLSGALDAYTSERQFEYGQYSDMLDYYTKLAEAEQEQTNFETQQDWEELYDKWYSAYMGSKVGISGI